MTSKSLDINPRRVKHSHFTQVVWKSSTQLGVGIATDGNTVFVVGQYRPAGNITNAGYYQKNVLPKGTEKCPPKRNR
uniref:SCP domain-containing protein n=1 Tax=Maylandia zebra TaxID=106582 RepID=A0A3P9CQT9_9CICH